jgi:ribose transport system permease protein
VNLTGKKLPPEKVSPGRGPSRGIQILSLAGPYLGLVLVVVLFSLLIRHYRGAKELADFLSLGNFRLLVVHASVMAAVALGMTIIMISGGIDLSVGYVVSLVTVTTMLAYRWADGHAYSSGLASAVAVAVGLGTGIAGGAVNGTLITRLKVIPFVVTLGTMGIARGLAQYWSGGSPVHFPEGKPIPGWVPWLGDINPAGAWRWLVIGPAPWSVVLLAIAVAVLLRYTVLGRYCYALGSNEATARLCGIRVERTKLVLYTIAGLLTGWGGILQFARSRNGVHDVAAGLELDVIAAVVVGGGSLTGGEGTITGTLVGALLIQILINGCSELGLSTEFRFIIIGLIIVVVSAINMWRDRRLQA